MRHLSPPVTLARAVALGAFAALAATPAFAQQEEDPSPQEEQQTREAERQEQGESLMAVAENRSEISLFVQAVKRAGLQNELEQRGPYTVFAPTDDALREHFGQEEIDRLLGSSPSDDAGQQDERELLRLVRSHIVTGEWPSDELQNVRTLQDVLGGEVAVTSARGQERRTTGAEEGEPEREDQAEDPPSRERETLDRSSDPDLRFGEAGVVETDLRASNGVIHLVDSVVETSAAPGQGETGDDDRPQRPQQERDTARSDTVESGG